MQYCEVFSGLSNFIQAICFVVSHVSNSRVVLNAFTHYLMAPGFGVQLNKS